MTTPSKALSALTFDGGDVDYVQKLKDLVFYLVQNQTIVDLALSGLTFEGGHDASGNAYPVGPSADTFYVLSAAGTLGGTAMDEGDFIIYTGGSWINRKYDKGGLVAANNLSDLASAATARSNLGLGNVDNTADSAKPISSAQQAAIDAVQALATFKDYDEFTSSGTWTKNASATWVYVEAIGGGGGGANVTWQTTVAGGGGGGFNSGLFRASDLGATETVTIGAGGAGGANGGDNGGSDGGDTTFGSHLTAPGGGGAGDYTGEDIGGNGGGGAKGETTSNDTADGGYSSGGGGMLRDGGSCIKGGAGGGGGWYLGTETGGTSIDGGDGGDGNDTASTKGGNGTAPGGGGGGSGNDGGGGDGAAGRVRVWQW